ncbi:MAG: hypothetical protein QOD92_843 [Acidimicrobiaceae bacterium]
MAELEHNPFEGVVLARQRPGFTVEPEAIAWNAVAFKVRGQRDGVACVPRNSLASFLDDLDDGRLDPVIRDFLAGPPSGRVLRTVAQTETPGLFDELSSPDAIVPGERRPGRPGRFGRGGGTPTGSRRDKRARRPHPRRLPVAGALIAGVLTVAAVAVALQSNDKKDTSAVATDLQPAASSAADIDTRAALPPPAGAVCVARPAGMTAWWPGDRTSDDVAGGRDGALDSTAGFAASGAVGPTFDFTQGGSFAVPNDPLWNLGTDFTIDLWVNFTDAAAGRLPFISHDDAGGSHNKWVFWFDDQGDGPGHLPGPALRFHINGSSPSSNPIAVAWTPTVNEWHFVAITRSASSYALYIDGGSPAQTADDANPIPAAVVPLSIGSAEAFSFPGQIDEVQLYSRALPASEIAGIFNAGSAGVCKN